MAYEEPSLKQTLHEILNGLQSERNLRETKEGLQRVRQAIPRVAESVARGAIASVPGSIGDISEFARSMAPETMQSTFGRRVAPTTREILDYVPRITPTHEGATTLEDVGAAISPGVGGVAKDVAMLTKGKQLGLSIMGPESALWKPEMAYQASKMEAKGTPAEEILQKTGMVRGLDNQWRSELSDQFAKMKQKGSSFSDQYMAAKDIDPWSVYLNKAEEAKYGRSPPELHKMTVKEFGQYKDFRSQKLDEYNVLENTPVKVKDVLDHPELFQAYPHLGEIKVKVGSGHGGVKGSYNQKLNEIEIAAHLTPEQARSTMLHELTHGIQGIEGFNRGANSEQLVQHYAKQKQDIMTKIEDLNRQGSEAYKADDIEKYRQLMVQRDVLSRRYIDMNPEELGYSDYLHHGGEAEARLVQRRANLSPEELRSNYPYQFTGKTGYGLDINPDEAIITTHHPSTINQPSQSYDYRGSHTAPYKTEDGTTAPGHELDKIYPPDVYEPKGHIYYGLGDQMDKDTLNILRSAKGNPDHPITVYRAVPKEYAGEDIHPGDWVTPNLDYAEQHGQYFENGHQILEKTVPAKHIYTEGNSLHEFGYDPTE